MRTLTSLDNARPQWLADAQAALDAAVAAAYGWDADISEEDALGALLGLNLAEGGGASEKFWEIAGISKLPNRRQDLIRFASVEQMPNRIQVL